MEIQKMILRNSDCYGRGRLIKPAGVMVHSMGVAQPDPYTFANRWNRPGVTVCPHAIVHENGVMQLLPWNFRGWHAGAEANGTHISFEICEPHGHTYNGGTMVGYDVAKNADYFKRVYGNAVELTAYLCKLYGLDPLKPGVVIDHAEGHKLGIASNHGDVSHWFPKHGKTMQDFRKDVAKFMEGENKVYNTIEEVPDWAREQVQWCIDNGVLSGTGSGLGLTYDNVRTLCWIHRAVNREV